MANAADPYGVIEAQRRFRAWMPTLDTHGQREVYGAVLGYFSIDGTATPTAEQLATLCSMHVQSVRRILRQLIEFGALVEVGRRPVLNREGIARGGSVAIWTIPPAPSGVQVGVSEMDSHPRPVAIPPAPKSRPTRAPEGAPLKVEKLKAANCSHSAMDEDGYCTACGSDVRP